MRTFDWHADRITRATPVTPDYRHTQNVRRFLQSECGPQFRFDRPFMQWMKDGTKKTMGEVADEWLKRRRGAPVVRNDVTRYAERQTSKRKRTS